MSKAALKKALNAMDKKSVIEMVCELYEARREAREYLEYWLDPDDRKALEEAKDRVSKMFFFTTSGKNRAKPTVTSLKNLVKDFSTLVFDPEKIADLRIFIAENFLLWSKQKRSGFAAVEPTVKKFISDAKAYVEGAALEHLYGERLRRLEEYADDFFRHPPQPTSRRGYRRYLRW